MSKFNVIVFNSLQEGFTKNQVKHNLINKLKVKDAIAEKMLSASKMHIKKGIDQATATKYETVLSQCGLKFSIEPVDEVASTDSDNSTPSTTDQQNLSKEALALVEKETQISPEPEPKREEDNVYQTPESAVLDHVFCRECGAKMSRSDRSCPSCEATASFGGRSKVAAGFLAFFLGGFGVHRFYLRQWWGIFYIPFGLLGLSFFVTLIEAIYFWCMSRETWDRKYGHLPPSSVWIIVAICIFPLIMVMGILAAVAIPAYQDYTIRAKVSSGFQELVQTRDKVEAFIERTQFVPNTNLDAGMKDLKPTSDVLSDISIIAGGRIVGSFVPLTTNGESYTLIYTPVVTDESVEWDCFLGTLPNRYRPPVCRE